MSLLDIFLITVCVLCVVLMVFLWRRGAIDKSKAAQAVEDFADDSRKQLGKWRDELDKR